MQNFHEEKELGDGELQFEKQTEQGQRRETLTQVYIESNGTKKSTRGE